MSTWTARYDDNHHSDTAYGVAASADGKRVFVTGVGYGTGYTAVATTIAYDTTTGAQLWVSTYQGPGADLGSYAYAVAADPGGSRVYVTGLAKGTCTTIAYDAATGGQLWLSQPVNSSCHSIAVSADGSRVYATGDDTQRWHTVSLDAESGALQWTTQYVGGYPIRALALGVSPVGDRVFVTGWQYSGFNDDAVTVAYSAVDGFPLWTAIYDGAGRDDVARAVGVSRDGDRVFVAGSTGPLNQPTDYATIAYDAATGVQEWIRFYDGTGGYDTGRALAVGMDGRDVYVTGDSEGTSSRADYVTVAYDVSTGGRVWLARYDGPSHRDDVPSAIAPGPMGKLVYVTGQCTSQVGKLDYGTVAYNARTGRRSWVLRYDGPVHGRDFATAVAVTPDGSSVYVTGASEDTGTLGDFLTQARIS